MSDKTLQSIFAKYIFLNNGQNLLEMFVEL